MMTPADTVDALAALAQETRLKVYRLLVQAGPDGLAAGAIGAQLGVPANTLSFHLKNLSQAGLLVARQEGRFIHYAADYAAMDELIAFLTANCCQGAAACLPKTAAVATATQRRAKLDKEKVP